MEIGNKRVYLCTRNQEMTPKAIEEVRGVEELIYRQFLIAIVLQNGVRRKASKKKLQKNFAKSLEVKNKSITFAPAFKTKDFKLVLGF